MLKDFIFSTFIIRYLCCKILLISLDSIFLSAFSISSWANLECKLYVLDYIFLVSLFLNKENKIFTGVYCDEYWGRMKTIAKKFHSFNYICFCVSEVEFSSISIIRLFHLSSLSLTYFYWFFIKPITLFEYE